jgi:hypothetical protein
VLLKLQQHIPVVSLASAPVQFEEKLMNEVIYYTSTNKLRGIKDEGNKLLTYLILVVPLWETAVFKVLVHVQLIITLMY